MRVYNIICRQYLHLFYLSGRSSNSSRPGHRQQRTIDIPACRQFSGVRRLPQQWLGLPARDVGPGTAGLLPPPGGGYGQRVTARDRDRCRQRHGHGRQRQRPRLRRRPLCLVHRRESPSRGHRRSSRRLRSGSGSERGCHILHHTFQLQLPNRPSYR